LTFWSRGLKLVQNGDISIIASPLSYEYSSLGRIVREFLLAPHKYRNFQRLFELSARITIASLRNLRAKGFSLPLQNRDLAKSLNDLAIDCLDDFFCSTIDQPYYVIYDFFRRHKVTDPSCESDELLGRLMMTLIIGYIKKKLPKVNDRENQQIANLKRRVKEIFHSGKYCSFTDDNGREHICRAEDFEKLRKSSPPLDYESILFLVEEAYLHTLNREDWCFRTMEMVASLEETQNFVARADLLRAMIAINAKYVDAAGSVGDSIPDPRRAMIRDTAMKVKDSTVGWIEMEVIPKYVAKKSLNSIEAGLYLKAVENFLYDYIASGSADSLPNYFRELMPQETHRRYLKDYKNSFETVINKALEYFKKNLGDSLQKRGLGTI